MTYGIVFSGPPGSGKDTLANLLAEDNRINVPAQRVAFGEAAKRIAFEIVGEEYSPERYEILKRTPIELLTPTEMFTFVGLENRLGHYRSDGPMNLRQLMILIMDNWLRATFGHDFWPKQMIQGNPMLRDRLPGVAIVSSGGFQPELNAFMRHIGEENLLLVKLSRTGCTWDGDSRRHPQAMRTLEISNDKEPGVAVNQVLRHATAALGWKL